MLELDEVFTYVRGVARKVQLHYLPLRGTRDV
jgi:hypothetical protein